jgi:flagellar protein FliO/FliZ
MDSLAQVGRLLLSLAFVLGVMWLIARRVRKSPSRVRNTKLIDVIGRQQLTKSSSIAVVRVLDQALILGVTDGQVTVLSEADVAKVEAHLDAPADEKTPLRTRAPRVSLPSFAAPKAPADAPATPAAPTGSRPLPPNRAVPAGAVPAAEAVAHRKSALAGSALSPGTWRATVDSIRDLTVRTR